VRRLKDMSRVVLDELTDKSWVAKKRAHRGQLRHQLLVNCDREQAFGFHVLSTLGGGQGYGAHLQVRGSLRIYEANWTDLMMWATVMGHCEPTRGHERVCC
jgi:hypothetical protein